MPTSMNDPFFILGFQRSGTTLLRVMLDSHPEIAIPLDTVGLWARYDKALATYNALRLPGDERRLVRDLIGEERIRLWEVPLAVDDVLARKDGEGFGGIVSAFYRAYADAMGKPCWGDKDPGNMTRMHLLNRWFPRCRYIHIIRDGRDACLSQLEQDFGFADILECAECWREQVSWVRRIGELLGPSRYFELRYEDLVENAELKLREVCDYLGVEYSAKMLAYADNLDRSIPRSKRHIWKLIDQPPHRASLGRWRRQMGRPLRIAFEKRAGPVLRELDYEVLPGTPSGAYFEELKSIATRTRKAMGRRFGRAR